MRITLPLPLAFLSLTAFGQDTTHVKKDSVQDRPWALYHAIEARLDSVFDEDQRDRLKLDDPSIKRSPRRTDSLWKVIGEKDDVHLAKVREVLDHYGWLGINDIGEKANTALFIVIQHADSLTQVTYLPMMRQAVQ